MGLAAQQTSFVTGDFNLDNFSDYASVYATANGFRLKILDGASVALALQNGELEGGYLPNTSWLADIAFEDPLLGAPSQLALTAGFNNYSQSAIENLLVSTIGQSGEMKVFTFQLDAGHFIATGTADSTHETMHSGSHSLDPRVINLDPMLPTLSLASERWLSSGQGLPTPTFAGALAQGGLILRDKLILSQGTQQGQSSLGNRANNNTMIANTQELAISLDQINLVSKDKLTGIIGSDLNTSLSAESVAERVNLAAMAYQAYTNQAVTPGDLALLAADGVLDGFDTAGDLANDIITHYADQVHSFYGADLDDLSSQTIIDKAYLTLFNRNPTQGESAYWTGEVLVDGLSKEDLPLAILQNTAPRDLPHVAMLSAGWRWAQVQWGTTAGIDGSFGQGLQGDREAFDLFTSRLIHSSPEMNWQSSQQSFDHFRDEVLDYLQGSPVSNTGFF
jgi:hypothetical protein